MRAYIIRRLLLVIPTVFLFSLIVFFTIRLIPGSVVDLLTTEQGSTQAQRYLIEHELGLDVPAYIQYWRWTGNIILHGDFGNSLWARTPVVDEILQRVPVTLELGFLALIIAQIIALPIGMLSALRQDTWGDYIARSFAILCIAVPGFWLGTMVIVFPSIWWGWMPPITLIPFNKDPMGNLQQFIIPAIILAMVLSGMTMRMTRTMMLEVLRQDYIRTAWAKGLRERAVIMRHALKNALIPVITLTGLYLPVLLGGTVVIEQIFCLPGIGRLLIESIAKRDYPIVTGIMLFFAVAVMLINLLVDLSYGLFDPRIRYK